MSAVALNNQYIKSPIGATKRMSWRHFLRFLFPVVVFTLLAVALWSTTFFAKQTEFEENKNKLIADALWARQNLQFQLESKAVALSNVLNATQAQQGTALRASLDQLFRSAPEIEGVLLRQKSETKNEARWVASAKGAPSLLNEMLDLTKEHRATSSPDAKPFFDGPYLVAGKQVLLLRAYSQPLAAEAWAIVNLQTFLEHDLPWWFAQANEVSLLEPNTAKLLAKTAKGGPGYGVYTHEMSLDVGSLSMMFFVNARKEAPRVFSNRMAALVSVLAVLLSLSLFFLWRDFRRRLHVEAKLREETAFRESMQDSMAVGLRVWDMDGCIRYVNPAFCRMVGLESSELVGKRPPLPYWLPSETDEYKRLVALVFAGQAPRKGFETTFKHKDGHAIDVLIVEAPLLDAKGQQNGWMSSILDITDRKKSEALIRSQEEKLQTTSRLALIGEMASNIAHELNQPLATMVSYAQTGLNLAEKPQPYMPDLRALFERLRDQSQRAGKVIKSVQSLVKERQLRREEVEVHAMLNALQPTFDALAKPSFATVQFNTEPDQLYITVDRIMLEQAIINLVKNALETSNDAGGQRWVSILAKLNDEQCEVIVEDNGPGVGEKDIETLFKPMFSTKRDGLGLGLNLCRSVAEVHGGKLTPALRPEGGMRFTLSFPAKGL